LWKNPAAAFPVHCDIARVITIIDPQEDGSFAATPATVSTGGLFGLPLYWPGPEPPFPGADPAFGKSRGSSGRFAATCLTAQFVIVES
jgi:hypothetical protein